MRTETPEIRELSERLVAAVSYKGNFVGNPQIFARLFGKLCGWAGPKGLITPETVFLSSYSDDPETTPLDELRVDVCLTVPEGTEIEGEVQSKVLPGGRYAVMHAEVSSPEGFGAVWNEIVDCAKKNGYEIDMSRPCYEVYLNNPEEHPERLHIIDVCLSVKPK
jgi:AraC family transcriptional regulator